MTVKRLSSAITHASFPANSNQHLFGFEFTSNPLKINCLISLEVEYFFKNVIHARLTKSNHS